MSLPFVFANPIGRWALGSPASCYGSPSLWHTCVVPLAFGWKLLSMALKSIAIGLALFCLLEPLAARQRPKPLANWIAIVADDSQSMKPYVLEESRGDLSRKDSKTETSGDTKRRTRTIAGLNRCRTLAVGNGNERQVGSRRSARTFVFVVIVLEVDLNR